MSSSDRSSRTATFVALARALETTETRRPQLFRDPLASRFLEGIFAFAERLASRPALRPLAVRAIDHRAPGARTSAIGRTRFIDDAVADALAHGAVDVGILGAGFDCRAHRIAALRGHRVFEVDRAETQHKSASGCAARPTSPTSSTSRSTSRSTRSSIG